MINFIKNLTLFEVIIINLGLLLINVLFVMGIKILVKRKYEKTQSVEETLYFQMKLGRYVQVLPILLTSFISAFTITPKARAVGEVAGFLIVMAAVLSMLVFVFVTQQLVLHNINKALRKTTATKGEEVKLITRAVLFMFIPMVLFFLIMILVDENLQASEQFKSIIKPVLMGVFYILLSVVAPLFTKYMIKAVPMGEGEIKDELKEFLNNAGLEKVKLYLWPTKKNKVANALVAGLIKKEVFISDYLLENLDIEETKAILAHEIGHIKRHHLWIRTALFLGIIVIFPSVGALFEWYEAEFSEISIWIGVSIIVILFIAYMGFFMYFIYRVQERQADAYVLELGVNPIVFISGLYKINKLNNMVMKFGKLDEKLQTHPSMAKRIKWIMEKSNVSYDCIQEIRAAL
jgi:STE24 endopeptidase